MFSFFIVSDFLLQDPHGVNSGINEQDKDHPWIF